MSETWNETDVLPDRRGINRENKKLPGLDNIRRSAVASSPQLQ